MSQRRVAIVTGAARGIGAATALELASRGYDVVLADISDADLRAVAAQARSRGGKALALPGDLTDLTVAENLVIQTVEQFGRVDLLVNNAAWRELHTMREISVHSWERTLRLCLTVPAFLSRWSAADMQRRNEPGVIVNVSSIMANLTTGIAPAYITAKGGIDALTRDLAALYGPAGIRIVGISPGAIDTELSTDITAGDDGTASELRSFSEQMIPLGRWAAASDVARVIAFLASDDAGYITGTSVVVDGGWSSQAFPINLKRKLRPGQF